jgi:hypothetical protein
MSTATLTRRPHGIDPGAGDPLAGPCRDKPALWDIDQSGRLIAGQVHDAADTCRRRCPLLAACRRACEAHPPQHTCVAAGLVWAGGVPHKPSVWLAAARGTSKAAAKRPCAWCGALFAGRDNRQRYCGLVCTTAVRDAKARERRARIALGLEVA